MNNADQITVGMPVYGFDEHLIGPVEELTEDGLVVVGRHIPVAAIDRVLAGQVYLKIVGDMLMAHRDKPAAVGERT
jgi:hypothetical protein